MKHYMSHVSIDRQGKVTKLKDIISDSSQFEVKSDEHKQPMLTPFLARVNLMLTPFFGTCQFESHWEAWQFGKILLFS